MVKIEGGHEYEEVFCVLFLNNINICGHLGLQPQKVTESSEDKIQGKDENSVELILSDVLLFEFLGVSIFVLECIFSILVKEVSSKQNICLAGTGVGNFVFDVLVMFWCVGDLLLMCFCDVLEMWWCFGDILVMVWYMCWLCFDDVVVVCWWCLCVRRYPILKRGQTNCLHAVAGQASCGPALLAPLQYWISSNAQAPPTHHHNVVKT
jgi:hypothetical protein